MGREEGFWKIPGLWLSNYVHESPLAVILELARVGMNQGGDAQMKIPGQRCCS